MEVGLTGFEPATSWSRTLQHPVETPGNPGNSASASDGCTTGCTSRGDPTPEYPPSPLVSALLALAQQLTPADRATLARLLLAGNTGAKGDAG
jgi:hypothetical protein